NYNLSVNGTNRVFNYLLTTNNPWIISTLDGPVYVNGTGVLLQVTSRINLNGAGPQIYIPGTNFSLSMYVSGASASIGGDGIINESGIPNHFQYYGLFSNLSLTISANN